MSHIHNVSRNFANIRCIQRLISINMRIDYHFPLFWNFKEEEEKNARKKEVRRPAGDERET